MGAGVQDTRVQGYRVQGCRVQGYRGAGVQGCRGAGVQECRGTGVLSIPEKGNTSLERIAISIIDLHQTCYNILYGFFMVDGKFVPLASKRRGNVIFIKHKPLS